MLIWRHLSSGPPVNIGITLIYPLALFELTVGDKALPPSLSSPYSAPTNLLAGYKSVKSEDRDKGRRKWEKTGGDRQLREGTEEGVKGREGGEKKRKRVGEEWKQKSRRGVQRHSGRRKIRHRNPRGTKIRKLGVKFRFGQLILRKIINIVATRCHFKAKMHHIRFRLGLRPRPRWGSSQRSPN